MKLIVKACGFVTPNVSRVPTTERPLWTFIMKAILGADLTKERLEELWKSRKATEKKASQLESVMELAANIHHMEGVLDESARGVFQGKILVRQGSQKTDGHQLNKTLLLSPGTEIDTKPELEIYADDVKCSHGATTGELEEEPLFYLRARGIDPERARAMLVAAFVGEALDEMQVEGPRVAFQALVDDWLARRSKGQE